MQFTEERFARHMRPINGSAIREIFKLLARPGMISFAGGNPSNTALEPDVIAELSGGVLSKYGTTLLQYGATDGFGPFRESAAAFLRAKIRSGIETILDLVGFDEMLRDTNLCITGEGRLDDQSMHGKAIHGVAKHCKKEGVPCIAIVGGTKEGYDRIYLLPRGGENREETGLLR